LRLKTEPNRTEFEKYKPTQPYNNGLYFEVLCDVVVKKFTFAISSPDEFLY